MGSSAWHANTTPGRLFYENRLEQLYGGVPRSVCGGSSNVIGPAWVSGGLKTEVSLEELANFVEQEKLPDFIINTTAFVDDGPGHHGARLANTVFEFGALRIGSDGFGYESRRANPELFLETTVTRAVAISGAAVDTAIISGPSQKTFSSALNQDLGMYVDNYNVPPSRRTEHWVIPWPLYYGHYWLRDKNGTRIYLSDGGHSDNLAAYAAIRRLPETLIIVDAEHDPNLQLSGFRLLKRGLESEFGVELRVPELEALHESGISAYEISSPVFKGRVASFPIPMPDGSTRQVEIGVRYIKLSIDETAIEKYPHAVQEYWGDHERAFPQESTVDQLYSPRQFQAYRDLGHWTVCNNYETNGTGSGRCPKLRK